MNLHEMIRDYKSGKLSTSQLRMALSSQSQSSLPFPLSEGQKGLWMLQTMNPEMSAYNVPICFRISPKLDFDLFKSACLFTIKQHQILSHAIIETDGSPCQVEKIEQVPGITTGDLTGRSSSEILSFLRERSKVPFSIQNDSLMRVEIYTVNNNSQVVLILIHHIIFDGSSLIPFIKTLLDAYRSLLQGNDPGIIKPLASYRDFVDWEQEMLKSHVGESHLEYWKTQLSGPLPVLELPVSYTRTSDHGIEGKTRMVRFSGDLSRQVKAFALNHSINLSVVFLGIFKVLLHRYTGQSDIIIGMPSMGRPDERFDDLVGYFINMITIRSKNIDSFSFLDLLEELKMTVVDGLDHAAYPFPVLVRELNITRERSHAPVFQVSFAYQNFIQSGSVEYFKEQYSDYFELQFVEGIQQEGEYELELEVFEEKDGFRLNFKYDPALFDDTTIKRMTGSFVQLTREIMANPSLKAGEYPVVSKEESQKILVDWNATQNIYPKEFCVHELFEKQVKKTPDSIALESNGEAMTYRELNNRSNQVACFLKNLGVKPKSLVGILMPRSLEMIIGLLGILKAGAAYVPFDLSYPDERVYGMIVDSNVPFILTKNDCPVLKKTAQSVLVNLDDHWDEISLQDSTNPLHEINSDEFAYVTYTSGTTGKPKGVEIRHKSINRLVYHRQFHFLNPENTVLQFAPISFDASTFEIWGSLCTGAKLVVCPAGTIGLEDLGQIIEQSGITVLWLTSALFSQMVENRLSSLSGVRYLLAGGDVLLPSHVKKILENCNEITLINGYGPTENTTFTTLYVMNKSADIDSTVPIGRPLDNTQVYILNQHLQPVPIGVKGELYTGGDGLSRGYLNQPELTKEKFVDNPFSDILGSKLYKTGDLVSYQPDGNILFFGRIDNQVKIRGFRIELTEIESCLCNHPQIEDCSVIVKVKENTKFLVAYYVSKPDEKGLRVSVERQNVKNWLRSRLPEYMIPAFFIYMDQLPVTVNGKIDRKALTDKEIVMDREPSAIHTPKTDTEAQLLAIWQDVLGHNNISPDDGFFDVGGDSLLAITVADRIKRKIYDGFTVTELFKYPNISELAAYISSIKNISDNSLNNQSLPECTASSMNCTNDKSNENQEKFKKSVPSSLDKESYPEYYKNSIAIIGISCQFPGANDYNEFWQNIREGKESLRFFSKDELRNAGLTDDIINNPNFVPMSSSIDHKDLFDADFFMVSQKDAELMDPQLRLLLMHSWKALEDAGYSPHKIPDTAVFMSTGGYSQPDSISSSPEQINVISNADDYVALILAQSGTVPTMISHKLGLKGPSFSVHSNCSSSLSGLYAASQCLLTGDCEYALVGAANIFPPGNIGYLHQPGLNFSSDGHCRAFDAAADGMIGGEGVAVIVVKRALDAINDGDHIYALMRGIRVNNDGSDKVGFYAPSVRGQSDVIQNVLSSVGIDPASIGYVEAHGTGTKLGDPIEFNALRDVYQKYTSKKQYCGLGSVKTNIGHLDTAAGLAGCIKVILSLYNGEIPPSLNYTSPNPNIDIDNSPFYIVDKLKKWNENIIVHRAALSSFGLGGTNAHAIFENFISNEIQRKISQPEELLSSIIPLSAKSNERLVVYVRKFLKFIKSVPTECIRMTDVAYTLQTGREPVSYRVVFIAKNKNELKSKLQMFLDGNTNENGVIRGESGKTVKLLEKDPDFKELLENWLKKKNVLKLAELWVNGLELNWEQLYQDNRPKRISLPSYPFAETVIQLPGKGIRSFHSGKKLDMDCLDKNIKSDTLSDLTYIPIWEPVSVIPYEISYSWNTVLLVSLGDANLLCLAFTDLIKKVLPEITILQIKCSDQPNAEAGNTLQVDSNDPNGFELCLKNSKTIDSLIFLCGTLEEKIPQSGIYNDSWACSPEIQLFRLSKYLLQHNPVEHRMDCFVITEDNQRIGYENTQSYGGGLSGLTYALAQSRYQWAVRNIDISSEDLLLSENLDDLVNSILSEKPYSRGNLIKFKNRIRYEQHIAKLDLNNLNCQSAIREGGSYVIAGGSGSVGRIITDYLIQKYHASVIWIGRRPENDTAIRKSMDEYNAHGSFLEYIQADVTDLSQMQKAVEKINKKSKNINGAIFSSVVVKYDNSIDNSTEAEFREVLDVKIFGSINFYEVFKDLPLDYMCFFSSAQAFSFSGASTLSGYAAGISFSDVFVRQISSSAKFPVGIMNWGFWLAPKEDVPKETLKFENIGFLQDKEGVDCFEKFTRILKTGNMNQILCMRISPAVENLIPLNRDETFYVNLMDKNSELLSILNTLNIPDSNIKSLLELINPNDFEHWMAKLLFTQLRKLGVLMKKGEKENIDRIKNSSGTIAKYHRFLIESLELLEIHGYVKKVQDQIEILADTSDEDDNKVWPEWYNIKDSIVGKSALKNQMGLTESCIKRLPEILRGEIAVTSILFPGSSMNQIEEIYKRNAFADYFNSAMADVVEAYIKLRLADDPEAKIRIIEIGAGTGGTSLGIFQRIKPWAKSVQYCYTDISQQFLFFAKDRYEEIAPYMDCKVWDITKSPSQQGIDIGEYDIAIAANVLHAVPNIKKALQNAKATLKMNGILLINEVIVKTLIGTLSFGLTDGWWLYEDENVRIPGSPILSLNSWEKTLRMEGFKNVIFPTKSALMTGQQIFAAESDGIIRLTSKNNIFKENKLSKQVWQKNGEPSVAASPERYQHKGESQLSFVKSVIIEHLSASLKRPADRIENDVAFSDYGVDSIISVNFVTHVGESLGIELNPSVIFNFITIEHFAEYIIENFSKQLKTYNSPHPESKQIVDSLKNQFLAGELSADALLESIKI